MTNEDIQDSEDTQGVLRGVLGGIESYFEFVSEILDTVFPKK